MPLLPGKKNIGHNVTEMERAGHSKEQSVAAALRTAYGHPKKRANGGHVGPLPGATSGRADKVATTVEDGSHILSADAVSAIGDGNSENGYLRLERMFPHSSRARAAGGGIEAPAHMTSVSGTPHVSPLPHIIGLPRPHITGLNGPHLAGVPGMHGGLASMPHLTKTKMAAGGEAKKVPVKLSHGEFAVSPRDVKEVAGKGDIDRGHRALDLFQMTIRREWIKKLKKLPGPAKD
jgi:hypothetical protein